MDIYQYRGRTVVAAVTVSSSKVGLVGYHDRHGLDWLAATSDTKSWWKTRLVFTEKTLVLGVSLEETQLEHDPKFGGKIVKIMETQLEHDGFFFNRFYLCDACQAYTVLKWPSDFFQKGYHWIAMASTITILTRWYQGGVIPETIDDVYSFATSSKSFVWSPKKRCLPKILEISFRKLPPLTYPPRNKAILRGCWPLVSLNHNPQTPALQPLPPSAG